MVQITADTSTMLTPRTGAELGVGIAPLHVTIAGKTYREMDEIFPPEFLRIIYEGNLPTSSQPSPADLEALFEKACARSPVLHISMADGLSGAYASACAMRENMPNKEYITVINSATLCGPHGVIVRKAHRLAREGLTVEEILEGIRPNLEGNKSFLIPQDFDYLRRGGRLSPLVSYVGKAIRLVPMLTQTEDGKQLTMAGVRRSFRQAIQYVGRALADRGVDDNWRIYISHADAMDLAEQAREILKEQFPDACYHILPLSPAFITQGGPGCVAVQVIKP